MNILVLNCGSSSVKFAVIELPSQKRMIHGQIDKIGTDEAFFKVQKSDRKQIESLGEVDQSGALTFLLQDFLGNEKDVLKINGIGHRVVHGGEAFRASTLITTDVIDAISSCNALAPLHNPANLLGIELAVELFPELPQVAVFDTAFHQTLPEKAFRYAVPDEWYTELGVRRYGFHGSSHRYVSNKYAEIMKLELGELEMVTVHLGNGSSATAVKQGLSVDTTMGFTPLEGLVMGTRSGDVDPGLFSYLHEQKGWELKDIHDALNKKSGLLGLSKFSSDMQELESNQEKIQIKIALDVMSYKVSKSILSLCAGLNRLDAIVFTGGIGENSHRTRLHICDHLKVLGVDLDHHANEEHGAQNRGIISMPASPVVCVVPTDEESLIAMDTVQLLSDNR